MSGYTKLFNSILASTIWREDDKTRIVWITLLAMSDKDGMCEGSIPGLADFARVTVNECEHALEVLSSPDKYSRTSEHEGRRIETIDGVGWQLLNHAKYRAKMSEDERREYNRKKQAEHRQKIKEEAVNDSQEMSNDVNDSQSQSAMSAHTDTDTDTKADKKKREDAAVPLAVFLGMVESGLSKRLGITTLPNQRLWHQKLTWAFQNNFTAAAVLECYDLLKAQEFWQTRSISAKTLIENLAHLPALRAGSGKGRTIETIPTADQIRADAEANDAARRPPPKPITLENVQ